LTDSPGQELTDRDLTGGSRQELTDGADRLTKELTDGPRQDMKDEVPDKDNRLSLKEDDRCMALDNQIVTALIMSTGKAT
jgi:hypothetical protein